jgi:hypothetical protein
MLNFPIFRVARRAGTKQKNGSLDHFTQVHFFNGLEYYCSGTKCPEGVLVETGNKDGRRRWRVFWEQP